MRYGNIFEKISNIVTLTILYVIAAGMYMEAKGFGFDGNGNIVLMRDTAIKESTFAQPIGKTALIHLSNPNYLGDVNAPLTIYEYSSFGCSHCYDFHLKTLRKLNEDFIKNGKIKVAMVYFPIDKKSMQAAMVAACIPPSEYHNFVDTIFKKQREWSLSPKSADLIATYASLHGITKEKALSCMKDDNIASEILANRQQGIDELNIEGTPSLVVDDGKTQELIPGSPSYPALKDYLTAKLLNK